MIESRVIDSKMFTDTWDGYLLSIVMAIQRLIPNHTVFTDRNDDLVIFSPDKNDGSLDKFREKMVFHLYRGPIENIDMVIDGKRISLGGDLKSEIMIRRILES